MKASEKFWRPSQNFRDEKLRRSAADFAKIVQGFGAFPNKFLRNAAEQDFSKSACVSTQALLAKFAKFAKFENSDIGTGGHDGKNGQG